MQDAGEVAVSGKRRAIALIALGQVFAMSLWFVSAAILPEIVAEAALGPDAAAALSSAVQAGFVVGALASAALGLADRFDPRAVFALAALIAASANAALAILPPGGAGQIAMRFITGACLAGVYPVGMKIAVGWGTRDRGFLVGFLVGALTIGSAAPHLIAFAGGADWRVTVAITSILAAVGGLAIFGAGLGPYHARAGRFDPGVIGLAWTDRRLRLAYAGYLGHMWELYAFWAWAGAAAAASFTLAGMEDPTSAARLVAFGAIAAGGLVCAPAGRLADRVGKARVARWAMMASGSAAILAGLSFGGPVWITALIMLLWGVAVIPDSAQFSALVADAAPREAAGSLMTFQTALGFALTIVTVQITPQVAGAIGWPLTLAGMAIGPALGVEAMRRLIALGRAG
ncbi:MFS transporter [Limibaculum sp. M0105]|uniref:MFS transporter n=1 Tax=Thermohalobaculum xanthum TaxID=2753746 RepID=A0A8J7M8W2_9RHOB|nr:MFS transporter [Thermohalobaculum xanthum]MBK0399930.1 MFS transporter [Thermohalobaculum xanthum]